MTDDRRKFDADHDLLIRIDSRLAAIEDKLSRLNKYLFGNGQPGLEQRFQGLSKRVWVITGGFGAVVAVSEVVYHVLMVLKAKP